MGRNRRRRGGPLPPPLPPALPPPPPPPPAPGASINDILHWLGHGGVILVLFETPSGFAVFNYPGVFLYSPKAIEKIWSDFAKDYIAQEVIRLKDFQTFENKTAAISLNNGVNNQLSKMIKKWLQPGQKLAVGKPEYKTIIEASLGIYCLFDEAVMELMWGLKNLMKSLVPDERVELTKEDCLPISQGMKIILGRYGFDVEPEMVNAEIIEMAYALHECNRCENRHDETLKHSASVLKEVSGIDAENWDALKIASALKVICYPEEEFEYDEILSDDELSQLVAEASKFEGKFYKNRCLGIYNAIIRANRVRFTVLRTLRPLVKGERPDNEKSKCAETEKV